MIAIILKPIDINFFKECQCLFVTQHAYEVGTPQLYQSDAVYEKPMGMHNILDHIIIVYLYSTIVTVL